MTARPPFAYFGGKMSLASQIVGLMPAHALYLEPFAGSLAVLLAKPPAKIEIANDLDGDLVQFWQVLRDRPAELIRAAALTPHSRAEYVAAADRPDDLDPLERARRTWTRLAQGLGGSLRSTGWRRFIDPAGTSISSPAYLAGYVERMAAAAQRLAGVTLECRPAEALIADAVPVADSVIYADPPYLESVRSKTGGNYRHELLAAAGHEALLEQLRGAAGMVIVSGYASELYDGLLAGWSRIELVGRHSNRGGGSRSRPLEVLWVNRDVDAGQLRLL